jgi:hypothetical protein
MTTANGDRPTVKALYVTTPRLHEVLKAQAAVEKRTMSSIVRDALTLYVATNGSAGPTDVVRGDELVRHHKRVRGGIAH